MNKFNRRQVMTFLAGIGVAGAAFSRPATSLAASVTAPTEMPAASKKRIALIFAGTGANYDKAMQAGADEAVAAQGDTELLVATAKSASPREQVALVAGFVKQKVDAIVIAATPENAKILGPACRKAMAKGIQVVSVGAPLPTISRHIHLANSSPADRTASFLSILAGDLPQGGDVAILAGQRNDTQNAETLSRTLQEWVKPAYSGLKLAEISYGNSEDARSYAQTAKILDKHSGLKAILALDPSALAAAARCISDRKLAGKIFVTGFSDNPAALKDAMAAGAVRRFIVDNPQDMGYAALSLAIGLCTGQIGAGQGSSVTLGRLASRAIEAEHIVRLAPFTIDSSNFARHADIE